MLYWRDQRGSASPRICTYPICRTAAIPSASQRSPVGRPFFSFGMGRTPSWPHSSYWSSLRNAGASLTSPARCAGHPYKSDRPCRRPSAPRHATPYRNPPMSRHARHAPCNRRTIFRANGYAFIPGIYHALVQRLYVCGAAPRLAAAGDVGRAPLRRPPRWTRGARPARGRRPGRRVSTNPRLKEMIGKPRSPAADSSLRALPVPFASRRRRSESRSNSSLRGCLYCT
jgi:hypothetical protein